ncbi:MAG: hypothetical protein F6J92_33165 [Symploca sp. SIO1A3]|nr:hypothetical protein [Symploca sp. SIO2C1]NER51425.1 hypothetical protein [Symploca sp. SIO1A3]
MFSYKRFSFFLGLSLVASTVVSANRAHGQSLQANLELEPKISQSASEAGGNSQSGADANSSSNLSDVKNGVKNPKGFSSKLGASNEQTTATSSTADISNNIEDVLDNLQEGESLGASASSVTEQQERNNSETSTSSPIEGTESSVLGNSASLSSELIDKSLLTQTSTSLVSEPTAEKIPESSPSLLIWLGLAGAAFVHTRFKSK